MIPLDTYSVVPWATKAEWLYVRDKLTTETLEDIMDAYETLSTWKARTDHLPAFVECTYGILRVMIQDYRLQRADVSDYDIRLAYSTEIIRFVNHVHSVTKLKGSTFYSAAKVNHVPEWIVTMRHEAAHGQTLPALETYHLAAKVCMTWLLKNYWFLKEKFTSKLDQVLKLFADDFMTNHVNVRLYSLYKKTIRLWETCCEISNDCLISDLPNEHLYYISNLVRLYKSHEYTSKNGDYCDLILKRLNTYCVNSNEHRLKDLKRSVIELMKYITSHERPRKTFIYTILQADFMFDFMHVEWKEVIYFVQIVKCFDLFVKSLFEQVKEDNLVALDVLEALAPSIENLRAQWPKFKERLKKKSVDKRDKMRLKKKYCKSYRHLKFPLKLQRPPVITLEMMEDLFKNPSRRTRNLICKYLPLAHPSLTKNAIADVSELLDIYCGINTELDIEFPPTSDENKIYTLDDVNKHFSYAEDVVVRENAGPAVTNNTWIKANECSDNWSNCPIGYLPTETVPDLIVNEVKCQKLEGMRINPMPPLVLPEPELIELIDYDQVME